MNCAENLQEGVGRVSGFIVGPLFSFAVLCVFLVLQSSRWGRENWLLYFLLCSECHVAVIVL